MLESLKGVFVAYQWVIEFPNGITMDLADFAELSQEEANSLIKSKSQTSSPIDNYQDNTSLINTERISSALKQAGLGTTWNSTAPPGLGLNNSASFFQSLVMMNQ